MYKNLEDYLEDIDHYLVFRGGKEDILNEIKSHILEKAENEYGEISENTINKVISNYGSPQKIAEKYTDDYQIITPEFKRYLFRYTGILFAVHLVLIGLAYLTQGSFTFFPFMLIPQMSLFETLTFIPMAYVYDLGLVGILLYLITQKKVAVRLPWLKLGLKWPEPSPKSLAKPKISSFLLMLAGYSALIYIYVRYHTIFFYSLNLRDFKSLLTPEASKWYSLALLFLLGIGILSYFTRFFFYSEWVNLIKYGIFLSVFIIVLNDPIEDVFVDFPLFNLKTIAAIILIINIVSYACSFLKSLVIIGRKQIISQN